MSVTNFFGNKLKSNWFQKTSVGQSTNIWYPPPVPTWKTLIFYDAAATIPIPLQGLYMIFIINQPYLIFLSSNSSWTDYYPEGLLLNWYFQEWINSVKKHVDRKMKRRTPSAQCMFNENSLNKMIDIVWLLYAIPLYEEN